MTALSQAAFHLLMLPSAGIAVFTVYLIILIVLGTISVRYQKTTEDFWVAGRRFGMLILVVANMAVIMHGGSILSGVAFAARFGGVAALPFLSFVLGFAVIFFLFARQLRSSRGFTIPDYLEERFSSRFLRFWSALVVAISSVVYLIAQIRGMGFILEGLLGVPLFWGMLIGAIVFTVYVALGGLLAVVWTNAAQFFFMWLGLIVLAPGIYAAVGGFTEVLIKVEDVAPGWSSLKGVSSTWSFMLSWYLIWFFAYATRLELITKMFAARNVSTARCSLPWTISLVIIFLLYGNFYLGAASRVLIWNQIDHPDSAFPTLVNSVAGPMLAAIVLTGIAGAAMSTTDTLLLLCGASVAHDILRKSVHEPRGIQKSEKYYVRVSRVTIAAAGLFAFLCALPDLKLILRIVSYAVAIVASAFFFPLLAGASSKEINSRAVILSSIGGVTMTIFWMVCQLNEVTWAKTLHPGVVGVFSSGFLLLGALWWLKHTGPGSAANA